MEISGANATAVIETEPFWGVKAKDGARGQPSEARGIRAEVAVVDAAGEVPRAVLEDSSSGPQDSKRPGATAGTVTECLGGRLAGPVLTIAAEVSAPGEELLATAIFTRGAHSSTEDAL